MAQVAVSHRISRDGRTLTASLALARADYSFRQLAEIRDLVCDSLFASGRGAKRLDLDERRNRVAIGVAPEEFDETVRRMQQRLGALGIDRRAVVFDAVASYEADVARSTTTALPPTSLGVQRTDPLAGGLRVDVAAVGGGYRYCSIGFIAQRNGQLGFVTASHCTAAMFLPDVGPAYQLSDGIGRHVGTEMSDPFPGICWLGWAYCRDADAAWFGASGIWPMRVGSILRPVQQGSTQISADDAYWYVTSEASGFVLGQEVHKVGRVTGWTSGVVLGTCVDVWLAWPLDPPLAEFVAMRCGVSASYARGDGDSGGSVFQLDPAVCSRCVKLAGTHSGHTFGDAVFAKISAIKSELGGTWSTLYSPGLPSPSIVGGIVSGHPQISWTGIPTATHYDVFRNGGAWVAYAASLGSPYVDLNLQVSEVFTGPPPPGVPAMQYYIRGRSGSDITSPSNVISFRIAVPPQPINVLIDGPSEAQPYAGCFWRASASGGSGTYTYSWKVNGVPVGSFD